MQSDTAISISLDLPERGVELAKLIYDVAQDCDTARSIRYSLDGRCFFNEMFFQIKIIKVQQENVHLPKEEIQKLVEATTAEHEKKIAKLAAENAAKREKVKQYINGNAIEGYELAYRLCKEDDSNESKELAYRMVHRLKNHPIEEQIDICRLYAESLIELGKSGNSIAKVYCDMATLVYPVYKRDDYSLCLSFYEKAYEYIDKPTRMLDEIIGFCNRFRLDELREKCVQKKTSL